MKTNEIKKLKRAMNIKGIVPMSPMAKSANGDEEEEAAKSAPLPADARERVQAFFRKNPSPPDDEVHDLAEEMGVHPSVLEGLIYKMYGEKTKTGQKHEDVPDSQYPQDQLRMGIKVEKEHTDDPEHAKEIAKDHLAELPDYYTRLKKMEQEGKEEKKAFLSGFVEELAKISMRMKG